MTSTIDPEVDAAYLQFVDHVGPGEVHRSVAVSVEADSDDASVDVVIDLDADGRILGIEVLGASALLRPETIAKLSVIGQP